MLSVCMVLITSLVLQTILQTVNPTYRKLQYSCGTEVKLIMECLDFNFVRLLSENRLQEIPDQAFKTLTNLTML